MPVWRCPHCGTPQPESARCWVCLRSTTSCATCRHFRRGIAGGLGLCALRTPRTALNGDEVRPCWTAPDPISEPAAAGLPPDATRPPTAWGERGAEGSRTFVPVDEPGPPVSHPTAAAHAATTEAADRWSLWRELEA
jgi:hypothetical protein